MRKPFRVGALVLAAVLGAGTGAVPAGAVEVEVPGSGGSAPPGSARTVTLLTGDRVTVQLRDGAGGPLLAVQPGKGREGQQFIRRTQAGDTFVIPSDAAALVASGRLDKRLFNVTKLVEFGYDDGSRQDLPLIVTYADGGAAGAARSRVASAGVRVVRGLRSINGDAVAVAKTSVTGFWGTAVEAAPGGTARSLTTGVEKVWLDGRVKATLDHSVSQIGAPAAQRAGHRGQGVKVAVLDTGIDAEHPDFAGAIVAERDFTGSASGADDRFGHGTHVASIITGSGAAANGRYQGVAPDAALINGKVLGDTGDGNDSGIIGGMEWAVEQGADVINMSLGSPFAGDGSTDPMDAAVNRLTAQSGALFVISAGNWGPSDITVASPGSADAALTVGAVDGRDALAEFSSRGPRKGDLAIKPDITAPGVAIAAALAGDSVVGEQYPVVDGAYVRLDGTSMSAPHVAGAAAILRSARPSWDADELKATLMGSAAPQPGQTVYQQGAGRVDVARAVTQEVFATPASVSNGSVAWPHSDDQPIAKPLTYRNTGTAPVTLTLATDVRAPDGRPAPTGMFTVSPAALTVPAGGSATATLTTATAVNGPDGVYGGHVTASAGQVVVRTPVVVTREVESYDVTVTAIDRNGARAADYFPHFVNLARPEEYGTHDPSGRTIVRVPAGRYFFEAQVNTPAGAGTERTGALFAEPVVEVRAARSITIDARQARATGFRLDRSDAQGVRSEIGFTRTTPFGTLAKGLIGTPDRIFVQPTRGSAPRNEFTFYTKGLYARPDGAGGYFGSPYLYQLRRDVPGRIPTDLVERVRDRDLHAVTAKIAATAPNQVVYKNLVVGLNAPATLTEYYTPGMKFQATLSVMGELGFDPRPRPEITQIGVIYENTSGRTVHSRSGRSTELWNAGVFGPAVAESPPYVPAVTRQGNIMQANVRGYADQASNRTGRLTLSTDSTTLRRDGRVIGESTLPGGGVFEVPPQVGTYQMEYRSNQTLARLSTSTRTVWTFRSAEVAGQPSVPLPAMVVRFAPDLDGHNQAPAGRRFTFPVYVQRQAGATFGNPRTLRVSISYDDGLTWRPVSLRGHGLRQTATVYHPGGSGFASLKAVAEDSRGNAVEQTYIRAYALMG